MRTKNTKLEKIHVNVFGIFKSCLAKTIENNQKSRDHVDTKPLQLVNRQPASHYSQHHHCPSI